MAKIYKPFTRTNIAEMRPYVDGETLKGISVAAVDNPEIGGMVARNPNNHKDKWYVGKDYFAENFAEMSDPKKEKEKTLKNSDVSGAHKNVPDLVVFGDGDKFKLICKASSEAEGWMKSTKAMEIPGIGCVVQVTTQQKAPDGSSGVAEALTFVPGVRVLGNAKKGRELVKI